MTIVFRAKLKLPRLNQGTDVLLRCTQRLRKPGRINHTHVGTRGALQIFCRPIKKLTHRTRPDYSKRIPRAWNLYGKIREASSDGYSFPSGDAMSGGAVAGSLIHATGSWWWLALALYPSFGRVYWHYHYIGDVLSGAGLGLAAAAINAQIFGTRPVAGVEVTACLVLFVAFMKFTASPPPKEKAN